MNRSGGVERQRCAREERDTRKGLTELKTRQEKGTRDAGNERLKERDAGGKRKSEVEKGRRGEKRQRARS